MDTSSQSLATAQLTPDVTVSTPTATPAIQSASITNPTTAAINTQAASNYSAVTVPASLPRPQTCKCFHKHAVSSIAGLDPQLWDASYNNVDIDPEICHFCKEYIDMAQDNIGKVWFDLIKKVRDFLFAPPTEMSLMEKDQHKLVTRQVIDGLMARYDFRACGNRPLLLR